MKPTWGIRKLNEYSVDKNTAIIITDSEKDNYYWADIPDGSLLVNDKTGNLSIKLTGESDWVPMGIRKDGTEKLVKDAVINVEYYTIVKFELEHNRFYYHDREEITRIGKIINGKAQFKVGSGLYLPGTNQLEVLINDSVHRNTIDGGLEEINMKYFQIDADDIRLGSTVTVRYINYERLSELYPFIYTQEQVPWFFEDKDLWINPSNNIDVNGLTITPLSYYVKYLDNNEAEVIIFTTKNSRLIASRKMNEYVNTITDKNVNRFKITRENNNFYINIFSTYPGYKTSFAKILIKGLISDEDKLTLDVDLTYPNSGMAKISAKTQLGNIVTFKRNNKKIYVAQNIGIGIQHTLAREENNYDIIVSVKNPTNGLTKEKILTIKKKKIHLTANIDHVTTPSGTTVTVETIPGSKVKIIPVDQHGVEGTAIIPETAVDADGRFSGVIPLTNSEAHYRVIVTNEKADNIVKEDIEVLLHNPRIPLSVNRVDAYDGLDDSLKGRSGISVQAESGSTIIIKDQSNNIVFTHTPSNLSVEDTQYNIPLFYAPETKTFTVEADKTNKVPESKTIIIQGYEKIDAPIRFQVKDLEYSSSSSLDTARTVDTNFIVEAGSTVTVYDAQNNIVSNSNSEQYSRYNNSINSFVQYNSPNYTLTERNSNQIFRFVCSHPLYKDQEVTKVLEGRHLPEHTIELKDAFVINPYADMYNSSAYQVLALKVKHNEEDLSYESLIKDFTFEYNNKTVNSVDDLISDNNIFFGGKESYKYFYDTDDLSNIETLIPNNKLERYVNNSYCINLSNDATLNLFIFKVDNFDDILHNRTINIKVNGKVTNDIVVPTAILHWSNLEESIHNDLTNKNIVEEDVNLIRSATNYDVYYPRDENIFIVDKNIKYIHPNLIKLVSIFHNTNSHMKLDALLNKMKEAEYITSNYEKRITHYIATETYFIDGNKIFDSYFKYFNFNSDIILFPSIFSYFYVSAYFHDSSFNGREYIVSPKLYLNCNIDENNIIPVKVNNQKFITNFYKIFEKLNINNYNSYKIETDAFSSINLIIKYNGKIIPSFFLGNYYNRSYNNIIIAKNVEEIKDYGLYCNNNSIIFLDYSKIKRFNNMSFINPGMGAGILVKNVNKNNNEILISLSDEEFVEDNTVYKLSDLKNVSNFLIFNKNYPFPAYLSDAFKLKIKAGNSHLKVIDSLFSYAAMESFSIEAKSITLIDEENDVISYDSIPSKERIYSINSDYSSFPKLFRAKYNIPEDIFIYKTNQTVTHFGNSKLKNIDITKFTNYYLYSYEFYGNQNLEKIIFPKHYLVKFGKYTKDAVQCMAYCQAKEIENIDFILTSTNVLAWDAFFSTSRLKTPININYIKSFGYSAFSQSNVSKFFYKKRTLTNDYLDKEVSIEDGYLESKEKILPFEVTVDDSSFYMTNMSQESFDRIKDNLVNIKDNTFFMAKQIKEVVLRNNKLRTFNIGFKNVNLEKLIIDSTSVEAIVLEDSFLNNSKLHESAENYKINAPNAKIFLFETKGAYSTLHTVNMPNLEFSCIAKSEKRKQFAIKDIAKEKPDIMSRHILDFGGNTNGIDVSYFNNNDSILKSNLEELEMPDHNLIFYAFSNVVDKNNIKIKKLTIYLDALKNMYLGRDILTGYSYNYINIIDQNLRDKDFLQNFRWPALEEIIIKNNYSKTEEYNVLGVKIKHVQA